MEHKLYCHSDGYRIIKGLNGCVSVWAISSRSSNLIPNIVLFVIAVYDDFGSKITSHYISQEQAEHWGKKREKTASCVS